MTGGMSRIARKVYYGVRYYSTLAAGYELLFVLGHMRSKSSLLVHLLNSNPEVLGYGETHIGYTGRRSRGHQRMPCTEARGGILRIDRSQRPVNPSRKIRAKKPHPEGWGNFTSSIRIRRSELLALSMSGLDVTGR